MCTRIPESKFRQDSSLGRRDSNLCILESELAKTLSPGGGTRTCASRFKGAPDRRPWKEFLGHWMFGLPSQIKGSAYEEPFTPSFRSLIAYFARRRGGFARPEKQAEEQLTWDWQVNLSYLLGLDWRIPFDLQKVRERERQLEELRKAARDGTVGKVIGTVAELRPKVTIAEAKAAKLREDLASFRVLDSYRDISDRAASIRSDMLAIERRAVSLKQTLDHLQNALEEERAPQHEDLTRLYAAVGVELPDAAKRRFSEVEVFHQSVIENRRARLQEEIAEVESQIADGERRSSELDGQRSEILRFLDGHGALEDFTDLQEKLRSSRGRGGFASGSVQGRRDARG